MTTDQNATPNWQDEITELRRRDEESQARIAELERVLQSLVHERAGHSPRAVVAESKPDVVEPSNALISRRGLVRLAGAGTAIVAAAIVGTATPAAAYVSDQVFANGGDQYQAPFTVWGGRATFESAFTNPAGGFVTIGVGGAPTPTLPEGLGTIWVKVKYSPGLSSWRKVAGPETAGTLHAITPIRVYDARFPSAASGLLTANGTRTVSVANALNVNTGVISAADAIPVGARAVVGNLTVVASVNGGFLYVAPGGTAAIGASTINWTSGSDVVANGFTCALDDSRQLKVFAGPGIQCYFIIDISGYYM